MIWILRLTPGNEKPNLIVGRRDLFQAMEAVEHHQKAAIRANAGHIHDTYVVTSISPHKAAQ